MRLSKTQNLLSREDGSSPQKLSLQYACPPADRKNNRRSRHRKFPSLAISISLEISQYSWQCGWLSSGTDFIQYSPRGRKYSRLSVSTVIHFLQCPNMLMPLTANAAEAERMQIMGHQTPKTFESTTSPKTSNSTFKVASGVVTQPNAVPLKL